MKTETFSNRNERMEVARWRRSSHATEATDPRRSLELLRIGTL
jgi:hypothetical protein